MAVTREGTFCETEHTVVITVEANQIPEIFLSLHHGHYHLDVLHIERMGSGKLRLIQDVLASGILRIGTQMCFVSKFMVCTTSSV